MGDVNVVTLPSNTPHVLRDHVRVIKALNYRDFIGEVKGREREVKRWEEHHVSKGDLVTYAKFSTVFLRSKYQEIETKES